MFFRTRGLRVLTPLVTLLAATSIELSAQDGRAGDRDPILLPDVVVTATSAPSSRNILPTSVTILSGETLREQGIRSVSDALRLAAGVTIVRSGGEGAQTSLFMRGGESDYVKILVDGVPVNQAGGGVDLADLSTAQVERIEIVRGPASILYGSDAVSGVVQIFTRRGRGAPSMDLAWNGGQGARGAGGDSYGVTDLEATLAGAASSFSYAIGGSHGTNDGLYTLNNERIQSTVNARVAWEALEGTTLSLSTRFSDGVFHFPTDGAGNPVDTNSFLDRRLFTVSAGAVHRLRGALLGELAFGRTSTEQSTIDDPDDSTEVGFSHSVVELSRSTADLRIRGGLPAGTLTLGVGYERSDGSNLYNSFHETFGGYSTLLEADRSNRALYAEYLGAPFGGINLTLGGRLDRNETFGTFETYRLGFTRELGEGTLMRGMIGKAFREPTFGENFGEVAFDIGNPDLRPERTRSWEIGIEHKVGPLLLAATWFDQAFEDLIQYTGNPTPPTGPNYVNIGAAKSVGLELTGTSTFGDVALEGSFTYLDTEVLDPGISGGLTFVEGEPLLRRPARSGSVTGRWAFSDGSVAGTAHFTGERQDIHFRTFPDPSVRVTLDSYSTFDLSGEYALPLAAAVDSRAFFKIENLFGAEYEGIVGFPAPGRVARVGVRLGVGG